MSQSTHNHNEWEFPRFRESFELANSTCDDIYDVKFYPFAKPSVAPVFAIAATKHILICRPNQSKDKTAEVLLTIALESTNVHNVCITWLKDGANGHPRLCVSGDSRVLTVLDALTGEVLRTLEGHGGDLSDLVMCPTNPELLASASDDTTIRLWNLNDSHEKQPCVAMLAGEGHTDSVLSVAFHTSGNYIISGGHDQTINLWVVPDTAHSSTPLTKPKVVHYPHFQTSEVHGNIVDCVEFCHDLILSKADRENTIVLWAITGFTSKKPLPPLSSAPTSHDPTKDTRSAFCSNSQPSGLYQRLLEFDMPGCTSFFMRFSLFIPLSSSQHPVLAMANSSLKLSFWDLTRLAEYHDYNRSLSRDEQTKKPDWLRVAYPPRKKTAEKGFLGRLREVSPTNSTASSMHSMSETHTQATSAQITASQEIWAKKYSLGPWGSLVNVEEKKKAPRRGKGRILKGIEPHRIETVPKLKAWTARQVAWSPDGAWCVVVGSPRAVALFRRW